MNEVCAQARDFLQAVLVGAKLDLRVEIKELKSGCFLNLSGTDDSLLLNEGGELLEAIEHLLNQIYIRSFTREERIICDVQNFRATREAELQAMALYAAEQVRKNSSPFTFAPMIANERRVIHLALANEPDLFTESIGEGASRRLKVSLRAVTKP